MNSQTLTWGWARIRAVVTVSRTHYLSTIGIISNKPIQNVFLNIQFGVVLPPKQPTA